MAWGRTDKAGTGHGDPQAAGGGLARQATASLAGLLAERGMTRKDLADRMGVSPGRVSQILSGGENLTLRSLAAVAECLDARVEIVFSDSPGTHEPSGTAPATQHVTAPAGTYAHSRFH